MGDPAGIGLEVCLKAALADLGCDLLLFAPEDWTLETADQLGLTLPTALAIEHEHLPERPQPGRPSTANAVTAIASLDHALAAVLSGDCDALVTAPIAKAVLYEAGFAHPGHTEFLGAALEDIPWPRPRGPVMMLAGEGLRTVPLTVHQSLASAPASITADRLIHTARVMDDALRCDFGLERPRIALAGLNPHAGEGGALGDEEQRILIPAAQRLRAEGIDITDPRSADTLFHPEARAGYDAALCMYHDQALIPVKTIDFHGAVNVTLGLPIVRTSPDHGAGFDIAGQNRANPSSFAAACRLAASMALARRRAA